MRFYMLAFVMIEPALYLVHDLYTTPHDAGSTHPLDDIHSDPVSLSAAWNAAELRRRALWGISLWLTHGTFQQRARFVRCGGIAPLLEV
eukprot:m.325617 g.325617  ORF g.325617 m.325617 type:complete len:89 (-) comp16015_c0_seq14:1347-1613(-)